MTLSEVEGDRNGPTWRTLHQQFLPSLLGRAEPALPQGIPHPSSLHIVSLVLFLPGCQASSLLVWTCIWLSAMPVLEAREGSPHSRVRRLY